MRIPKELWACCRHIRVHITCLTTVFLGLNDRFVCLSVLRWPYSGTVEHALPPLHFK